MKYANSNTDIHEQFVVVLQFIIPSNLEQDQTYRFPRFFFLEIDKNFLYLKCTQRD